MSRYRDLYKTEIVPALMKQFSYRNVMEAPKLTKIVVNLGMGEALENAKSLDFAVADVEKITGQHPIITRAKKSIASFKLRQGNAIGVKVTLRGKRMYDFLDRLCNISLPRQRDFRGISPDGFDGHGNYNLGLREQLIWPEIEYDKIDRVRGMNVTIVTTAKSDEEAKHLLELFGMPFRKR